MPRALFLQKLRQRGAHAPNLWPLDRRKAGWTKVFANALAKEKFPPDLRKDVAIFSNYTTGGGKIPPHTASDLATLHRVQLDEKTTDEPRCCCPSSQQAIKLAIARRRRSLRSAGLADSAS